MEPTSGWLLPTSVEADLLVMCTGNLCRSPVAEAMLQKKLASRSVAATVSSVGLLKSGMRPPPEVAASVTRYGIDIAGRMSRHVEPADISRADLVIAMARNHVREAVVTVPSAWKRIFTLKEIIRRGAVVGRRAQTEELGVWLDKVADGRSRSDLLGESQADDIPDPLGQSQSVFDETAALIDQLTDRLIALAWPG